MGSLSDYAENKLLDLSLENTDYTPVATLYLALGTSVTDAALTGEPSGNNYSRKSITVSSEMAAASSRAIANNGTLSFAQASGSWGTMAVWALFDASTSGNMLAHGDLAASKAVVDGNTPSVASGEIEVSIDAGDVCNDWANSLLDRMFRNQALSQPDIKIALFTSDPGDTGVVTGEPSGNNYARLDEADWDAASGGASENTNDATFATPSGSWGLITHAGLTNGAGDVLFYGTATPNQTPDNGDTVKYSAGDFDVSIA